MEKEIFLVLTQTDSVLSHMIRAYTGADYNHISIALSKDLEPMYSFGRRQAYNPYWGGFVKEHLHSGTFKRFPRTKAAVLSLRVPEESYNGIRDVLEEMYLSKEQFGYDFIGLCLAAIRIEKRRNNKYYCSDFVKTIFQKFKVPGTEELKTFTAPIDFISFPGATVIYRGLLKEYSITKK